MKTPDSRRFILNLSLTLLLSQMALQTAHAEIYKWVDEKGRTHYSETKPDTAKAKAVEVKAVPQAGTPQAQTQATEAAPKSSWQEQERLLKQRQAEEAIAKASKREPGPPQSLSNGRTDGSDASRCNLARDIINGALRHSNGAPIDQNDIDVAKSDIRNFCR